MTPNRNEGPPTNSLSNSTPYPYWEGTVSVPVTKSGKRLHPTKTTACRHRNEPVLRDGSSSRRRSVLERFRLPTEPLGWPPALRFARESSSYRWPYRTRQVPDWVRPRKKENISAHYSSMNFRSIRLVMATRITIDPERRQRPANQCASYFEVPLEEKSRPPGKGGRALRNESPTANRWRVSLEAAPLFVERNISVAGDQANVIESNPLDHYIESHRL